MGWPSALIGNVNASVHRLGQSRSVSGLADLLMCLPSCTVGRSRVRVLACFEFLFACLAQYLFARSSVCLLARVLVFSIMCLLGCSSVFQCAWQVFFSVAGCSHGCFRSFLRVRAKLFWARSVSAPNLFWRQIYSGTKLILASNSFWSQFLLHTASLGVPNANLNTSTFLWSVNCMFG